MIISKELKVLKVKCNYNLNENTVAMLNELHNEIKVPRGYIIDKLVEDYYFNNFKIKEVSSRVAE